MRNLPPVNTHAQQGPGESAVRRRRVIYIPGYDPAHSRKYRELFRAEGARQAALSGYRLAVSAVPARDVFAWDVDAEIEGARVATRVEALVWSDIVKRSMEGGVFAIYGHLARTAWIYFSTGAIFRLMRLRKGPVIAAFYPVAVLLGQLALALGAAAALGTALALVLPLPALLGTLLALPVVPPILRWFRRHDGRVLAHYLMHDFAFTAAHAGADPPELAARMRDFGGRIEAALASGADEVLVVGHSSGAQIAASVLARLLREGRVPRGGPVLSFLTLGQVIPMASFLPRAEALRADLALLSQSDRLTWVDVTAPGDGCSFALCDPVAVSGAGGKGKRWPLVISAAYSQTLRPETWARLRWRFFRLHFQYLCAFDALPGRVDDYDYFRITAGPLTLADRLGARSPSPARIERALSGHAAPAETTTLPA